MNPHKKRRLELKEQLNTSDGKVTETGIDLGKFYRTLLRNTKRTKQRRKRP